MAPREAGVSERYSSMNSLSEHTLFFDWGRRSASGFKSLATFISGKSSETTNSGNCAGCAGCHFCYQLSALVRFPLFQKPVKYFFQLFFSLRFVIRGSLFVPVRKPLAGLQISSKTRAKLRRHANANESENRKWMFSAHCHLPSSVPADPVRARKQGAKKCQQVPKRATWPPASGKRPRKICLSTVQKRSSFGCSINHLQPLTLALVKKSKVGFELSVLVPFSAC